MRTKVRRNQLRVAAAMVAVLALTGCGLLEDQTAETTTEVGEEADRLAQLEAELRELRAAQGTDGGEAASTEEGAPEPSGDEGDEEGTGPVAASEVGDARVFDVNETQTNDVGDLEVTVERIIVQDYHVEVELSALNDHPEERRRLWMGRNTIRPQLFDEQDRRFEYQHPAGYNSGDSVALEPGQRLEAVVMFGGRLHPDAQTLTLRFLAMELEDWEWTVDLAEAER